MSDPLLAHIEAQFGEQIRACERIRDFVRDRLMTDWPGRAPESVDDYLLLVFLARSFDTFCGSVVLLRSGWGAQSAMLNRSLFEDMVDAHWVVRHPDDAGKRLDDHHLHSRMLLADAVAKYPGLYGDIPIPEFSPEDRKRLDAIYTRYGTRSWTAVDLHTRVEYIADQWPDEASQTQLRVFRDIVHRENNQILHVTATSLQSKVELKSEALSYKVGPRDEMLDRSSFAAFWIFDQLVGLIVEHFAIDTTETEKVEIFSLRAFVSLSPEQMSQTGRNAPCPCGSGFKFKRCHGV